MAAPDLPADAEDDDDEDKADPAYIAGLWLDQIKRAQKKFKDWEDQGKDIVKRYRDEKAKGSKMPKARYNILWSNVQTLMPALYAKQPKAIVARRFGDKDAIGRVACEVLERSLTYQIDSGGLHKAVKLALQDYLLPGRGQVWIVYNPEFEPDPDQSDDDAEPETIAEKIKTETVDIDFVVWTDFLHDHARTWDEVTWVARKSYQTKTKAKQLFGDVANNLPYNFAPEGLDDDRRRSGAPEYSEMNRAIIWEIWNKPKKQVIFIAEEYPDAPLKIQADPLHLLDFFPCPAPLLATTTTDSLIPVPYYKQYEFQAKEMDDITGRISRLIKACQVKGVYDVSVPALGRLFDEAEETDLIPVETWNSFQSGAGLKGAMDWLPIEQNVEALKALYETRALTKSDINEISGMSDIIRGQGDPDETATGTRTKGQFATLRLKDMQGEVARFARDIVRLMAEVISGHFSAQSIEEMSSAREMDDLIKSVPMPMQAPAPSAVSMGGPSPTPMMGTAASPQRLPFAAATR